MVTNGTRMTVLGGVAGAAFLALTALFAASLGAAQNQNQSSAQNPYFGSVTTTAARPDVMPISLDDAIRMALEKNLALTLTQQDEGIAHAQKLEALAPMLPTVTGEASTGVHQYNLAAQGFRPGLVHSLSPGAIPMVVVVDVTSAQANYSQTLFDASQIASYRSARANEEAARFDTQSSRGLVVLAVGTTYLQAVAAASRVEYARALLRTDEVLLNQAVEQHKAGVVANLDELRARVIYQSQQQTVIAAENSFEKAKIALNREIGLPAEQKIALSDAAPYQDLATITVEEAQQQAYRSRQDYLSMQSQVKAAQLHRNAARYERLPTLSFGGNYGVTGITGGLYHGTFAAVGSLNLPLFEEGKLRGDRAVAEAQLGSAMSQLADMRSKIDAQLRDSLLDVQSSQDLVRVAQSNIGLATKTLEQVTDRYQAGIDDNLPVVEAQSTLANAQSQLVDSLYRYNQAKLGLARNLGIVDTQYKVYLGR
ncbi:MAG TPA: TolC family protein [Acidisarcina sp.]|nr:TolC family protein [Acidisarcina sp.]